MALEKNIQETDSTVLFFPQHIEVINFVSFLFTDFLRRPSRLVPKEFSKQKIVKYSLVGKIHWGLNPNISLSIDVLG